MIRAYVAGVILTALGIRYSLYPRNEKCDKSDYLEIGLYSVFWFITFPLLAVISFFFHLHGDKK